MRKVLKGKDFMVFVGGKAIALATSHTLTLTAETSDTSSKDNGIWSDAEITGMSFEVSAESIGSAKEEEAVDISYEELFDLMLAGEKVDIVCGIPKNITTGKVPETGWTAPDGTAQAYYKGKALITNVQLAGATKENSTLSATFTGAGKLEKAAGGAGG